METLTQAAKKWQQDMQGGASMQTQEFKPLRSVLFQCLLMNLNQRLVKLSQCQPTDQMFQTALQQGLLTPQGEFPFHQWDATQQQLKQTDKPPIGMARMLAYSKQLIDITADPATVIRFHALRTPKEALMVPWKLQISLRDDELHSALTSLCGSKAWCLLGVSLKSHSLRLSPLAMQLQQLIHPNSAGGKSQGKGKHKGKTKGKSIPAISS